MKITIVGEAPSKSSDPERPFCGWSGNWLAKRAGLSGYEELAARARLVNVLKRWPGAGARDEWENEIPSLPHSPAARHLRNSIVHDHGMILLAGKRVAAAFGFELPEYFEPIRLGLSVIVVIPHPSGSNRWWYAPVNRARAEGFLRALFMAEDATPRAA